MGAGKTAFQKLRQASKNSPDLSEAAIRHFCLLNPLDFCQFTFQTMETIILITMLFDFSSVMNPDSSHHFMFSVFGHHSAASYISLAGHFAKVHVAPHQRGAQSRPAASSDQGPWGLADVTGVTSKSFGTCWELAKLRSSNIPWKGFLCKGTCA